MSVACEESTLIVRGRCVSFVVCQERVLARARPSDKVGRSRMRKTQKSKRAKILAEVCTDGEKRGWGWDRESRGARRRRRRVRERSCGDGECASGWQTALKVRVTTKHRETA
eukprot:4003934-Pleurochrysis_carterae.AAC.8